MRASDLLEQSATPFDSACLIVKRYEQLLLDMLACLTPTGEFSNICSFRDREKWYDEVNVLFDYPFAKYTTDSKFLSRDEVDALLKGVEEAPFPDLECTGEHVNLFCESK